jgi:protein-tyrosine phosphatase
MTLCQPKTAAALAAALMAFGLSACIHQQHSGGQPIPFTEAGAAVRVVGRDPDGTNIYTTRIAWEAPGATSVTVRAGREPGNGLHDQTVVGTGGAVGDLNAAVPLTDSNGHQVRWYFALTPDRGAPLVIADRNLHLASAPNFRDAGGYRTMDGKWVRMGLLFRSDQLDRLSPADLDTLRAVGIHLVCDLRTDIERSQGMDRLPAGAQAMIADVAGGDSTSSGIGKLLSSGAHADEVLGNGRGIQLMIDANRQFVESASAKTAYKALFERLADPKMLPAIFHCTAGKDRTGWAEAVFLSIMGVPRETIMRDYLLSNDDLKAKNDKMLAMLKGHIDPALLDPLLGVRPEYLQAGFDAVDKDYGSMDRYAREGLGLSDATIQALRNNFLAG